MKYPETEGLGAMIGLIRVQRLRGCIGLLIGFTGVYRTWGLELGFWVPRSFFYAARCMRQPRGLLVAHGIFRVRVSGSGSNS